VNNELERMWNEVVTAKFVVLSWHYLAGFKKTMKTSVRMASVWEEI
jgi:hypothetical protein